MNGDNINGYSVYVDDNLLNKIQSIIATVSNYFEENPFDPDIHQEKFFIYYDDTKRFFDMIEKRKSNEDFVRFWSKRMERFEIAKNNEIKLFWVD